MTFGGTGAVAPGRLRAVRALTLLAIDPRLGGAVLVGPPGAGKGTAARAFRSLVGVERPFIGASAADGDWDRWRGSVDWEATLREGRPVSQPGLWDRARGGTLFLTQGEAMGRPLAAWLARALEEPGAPVLLVSVDVLPHGDTTLDLDILARRLAFWLPLDGAAGAEEREAVLQAALSPDPRPDLTVAHHGSVGPRIREARALLPHVQGDAELLRDLLAESARLGWANPVLDRLLWRAARAHAALEGRQQVRPGDAQAALELVIGPRGAPTDRSPSDRDGEHPGSAGSDSGDRAQRRNGAGNRDHARQHAHRTGDPSPRPAPRARSRPSSVSGAARAAAPEEAIPAGSHAGAAAGREKASPSGPLKNPDAAIVHVYGAALQWRHHRLAGRLGRPSAAPSGQGKPRRGTGLAPHGRIRGPLRPSLTGKVGNAPGRPVAGPKPPGGTLALAATVMAALPHQPFRRPRPGLALALAPEDMRWRKPATRPGSLFIIAVDGSGSMGAARTRAAKGLALALLRRAYVQRAHVALLRVAGTQARVVLPPSRSGRRAERALAGIATGGGSPLAAALAAMEEMAVRHRRRYPEADVVGLLLTDGRANVPWRPHHRDATTGNISPAALQEELVTLASRLRRRSIALAVLDRDGPGSPATDARALAQRLGCPFIAL